MLFMSRIPVILFLMLAPLVSYAQQQSVVHQVHFGRNKHELSAQNKQILGIIADTLSGKTNYIIYINGHADNDADSSYNQQLSLRRSLAVKEFLVERGIKESLLRVQALGEEQPLVANTTPMQKAKNRRVELVVLFQQEPRVERIEPKKETIVPGCNGDTTVTLEGGYKLVLSKCDWERNSLCLRVEKKLSYKFEIKENWLKKHIGFKNYKKVISYEPRYEFYVVSCIDSCFQEPVKLYISHYQAPGLKTGTRYSQKKNDKNGSSGLTFKKTKLGDSAYYVADIYCPGVLNCGTDNRCTHLVGLHARNKISILSYSYYVRGRSSYFDSLVEAKPLTPERLTDEYTHAFFHTLTVLYNGDTVTLHDIPIDVFAHGRRKIKTKGSEDDKAYFMFIPFRKKYSCGHYKKYKIRAKDMENLRQFDLSDLEMKN
jgi:hypothetical protein